MAEGPKHREQAALDNRVKTLEERLLQLFNGANFAFGQITLTDGVGSIAFPGASATTLVYVLNADAANAGHPTAELDEGNGFAVTSSSNTDGGNVNYIIIDPQ